MFQTVFYTLLFLNLRRSLAAWRRRAFNIREDSETRLRGGD